MLNQETLLATWDDAQWLGFLQGQCSTEETLAVLLQLQPHQIELPLFQRVLKLVQQLAIPLPPLPLEPDGLPPIIMDCCGTGGSGLVRYNTSTTVAFIMAAGGVPVVKFGNRAISGTSGSFDFLEAIGLSAVIGNPNRYVNWIERFGLAFLFAPDVYPALKALQPARQEVGVSTIFNYMGPLLNPLQPQFRVLGCSHEGMMPLLANTLAEQSTLLQAVIVRSQDGLDELNPAQPTDCYWVSAGQKPHLTVQDAIIKKTVNTRHPQPTSLSLATPKANATLFKALLTGDLTEGNVVESVVANAGLCFLVTELADTLEEGTALAEELLQRKAVLRLWQAMVEF
jgi:anthranilate phosphoribosyltransferase